MMILVADKKKEDWIYKDKSDIFCGFYVLTINIFDRRRKKKNQDLGRL